MAYKGYSFYEEQMTDCDREINEWLEKHMPDERQVELKTKTKKIRHHAPKIKELHAKIVQL